MIAISVGDDAFYTLGKLKWPPLSSVRRRGHGVSSVTDVAGMVNGWREDSALATLADKSLPGEGALAGDVPIVSLRLLEMRDPSRAILA
ncbi:hypothetical protein Q7P37_002675 [Cladosporium fusiforme]